MALFTTTTETPRDVENIYQEFECFFSGSIREVQSEWNNDKKTYYENSFENVVENKLFEGHYIFLINEIKKHILEQLGKYNSIQILSFVEKQRIHYESFFPEKRKKDLYEDFLVMNVAMGDESILGTNYKLTEGERTMAKLAYEKYLEAYILLGQEMEAVFTTFLTFVQKFAIQNYGNIDQKQFKSFELNPKLIGSFIDTPNIIESHQQSFPVNLKKEFFKRHPKGLELLNIPNIILEAYGVFCKCKFLEISGFGEIPLPAFALMGVESAKQTVPGKCFQAYAMGFLVGYNDNLVPFIDNLTSRKEKIIFEAMGKGAKGFTERQGNGDEVFFSEDFYESGVFEGKRYKAWSYIFETPSQFMNFFKHPQKKPPQKKKQAEKWYALYHMILIAIGKQVPNPLSGSKADTIRFGKDQYGTNQGFYQELKKIDLNDMTAYVRSLPPKDRKQWKMIITKISNKDADVISWLNKQPN